MKITNIKINEFESIVAIVVFDSLTLRMNSMVPSQPLIQPLLGHTFKLLATLLLNNCVAILN